MDRFDEQLPLWRELRAAPLKRPGFTDQLRHRIEQALMDEGHIRKRHFRPVRMAFAGGSVLAVALAVFFVFWKEDAPAADRAAAPPAHEWTPPVTETAEQTQTELNSGVLLGLRRDRLAPETDLPMADYRTIWIAPERNRPVVKAEGDGLLVPYRLDFWSVYAVNDLSEDRQSHRLTADVSTESRRQSSLTPDVPLFYSERVIFVGNRYIAIEQTAMQRSDDGWHAEKAHVVEMLDDVRSGVNRPLPLQYFVQKDAPGEAETTNWTLTRRNGQWVPLVDGEAISSIELTEELTSHDQLCRPWTELAQLHEDAKDAVCSPQGDLLVLVAEDRLLVYPMDNDRPGEDALTLPLLEGEELVMAQWAVGEYVQKWTEMTAKLLH